MSLIWFCLMVAFILLEAFTVSFVSMWFAAGSLAALLVSLFLPDALAVQLIVFVVVSAVCLLGLRPLTRRLIGGKKVATNADANIGKPARVVQEIGPGSPGRAKLGGLEWMAVSDHVMPVGTWARVVAIDGVKLVLVPGGAGGGDTKE